LHHRDVWPVLHECGNVQGRLDRRVRNALWSWLLLK